MQRGMLGVYNDEDWQTRLSGFYTTSAFLDSVHRGRESDPNSTSFVPAIARALTSGKIWRNEVLTVPLMLYRLPQRRQSANLRT